MVFIPNVSKNGACDRGRTCDINLGRVALYQLSYARINMVARDGFEPSKAMPTDLQSAPFDHSGTSPFSTLGENWSWL